MNPVRTDSTADHDHGIPGPGVLLFARLAVDRHRQGADGAAEDERLAEIAAVEDLPASSVGDSTLVAAVDDAEMDPVADPLRMQQALR